MFGHLQENYDMQLFSMKTRLSPGDDYGVRHEYLFKISLPRTQCTTIIPHPIKYTLMSFITVLECQSHKNAAFGDRGFIFIKKLGKKA